MLANTSGSGKRYVWKLLLVLKRGPTGGKVGLSATTTELAGKAQTEVVQEATSYQFIIIHFCI